MLKALQEAENEPAEPGNQNEMYSNYFTLACMLAVLNGNNGHDVVGDNGEPFYWV